jgi:hypothetical protein
MITRCYDFSSATLAKWGITIAAMCEDVMNATYDAATQIGQNKGYGAEGIGEVHEEICNDLGLDDEGIEDLDIMVPQGSPSEDDCPTFTIDGQTPNVKEVSIAALKLEIEAMTKTLACMKRKLAKLQK